MNFQDFLINSYQSLQKPAIIPKISSVCSHSTQVQKNSLFIALKGYKLQDQSDGHQYVKKAIQKGASALLVEDPRWVPSSFKGFVLQYKDLSLFKLLNQFYDYPSQKLFNVGITGTNGKTSFCYLLEHLYKHCGWPTGVIGTVDQHFHQKSWPAFLTTPTTTDLFKRLHDFVELSARAVIMEVSSIALDQNRVQGIDFKALVFSNLSQDHLNYHGTMEKYFLAKKKLFIQAEQSSQKNLFYLLNQDDIHSHKLKAYLKKPSFTFGKSSSADFCFQIKNSSCEDSVFQLQSPMGNYEFSSPVRGEYNVYNTVSALACAMLTGFKAEDCRQALKSFKGVPGRLEQVSTNQSFQVFIDYAHTPQALSSVLKNLRSKYNSIILVFGCGGDRDKNKRVKMMQVAVDCADSIFLTTDNPRHENPEQIAKDTLTEVKDFKKITCELDRSLAIKKAIQSAKKGDCVLIAGKGHEKFQIIRDKKIPFCDKQTVQNYL